MSHYLVYQLISFQKIVEAIDEEQAKKLATPILNGFSFHVWESRVSFQEELEELRRPQK